MDTIYSKTMTISAGDLKRAFSEEKEFKADRYGHNGYGASPRSARVTYLAHAKGYVMARHPGCMPFAIPEKLWRSFPAWDGQH